MSIKIETDRLILQQWQKKDFKPFALMNADPNVRKYFPSILTEEESNNLAIEFQKHIEEKGWGFWAVSLKDNNQFIGFIGLNDVNFETHFTPTVEIGWRLAYDFWKKGYATEAAQASLKYGFEVLNLTEIVSFTASQNISSRRVMERLHMHHDDKDDFDHPKISEGNWLKRHVLYRINKTEWLQIKDR
jgi:3-dehydroquinate dehydratase/shikimate dehydrogenase